MYATYIQKYVKSVYENMYIIHILFIHVTYIFIQIYVYIYIYIYLHNIYNTYIHTYCQQVALSWINHDRLYYAPFFVCLGLWFIDDSNA